ncbi:MAG: hypothetical protein IKB60_04040 [Clostridia bacterium]|nr:hypothetical protein [Clostridia bacterium]
MKKKYLFLVFKKGMLFLIIMFFMLVLSLCGKVTIPAARDTLLLCAENIIPSLFPFFVMSSILIKSGFAKAAGRFFSYIMKPLFSASGQSAIAFIIGIISGYPMGAKTVSELYRTGAIPKSEAERLLPFCNNSGPLFVIGAVGTGFLGRADIGLFLYLIHLSSAVITGFFLRFFSDDKACVCNTYREKRNTESFGMIFSESVKSAVNSVLFVCGFVVFFATLSAPFTRLLPENSLISVLIKGFLEVTIGIKDALFLTDGKIKLCLISALLGFGGICVLLQVMGIAKESGLGIKYYFWGKLFQGVSSAFLCNIFYGKIEVLNVFATSNVINFETGNFGATITSVFIICCFYFTVLAFRKKILINKKMYDKIN